MFLGTWKRGVKGDTKKIMKHDDVENTKDLRRTNRLRKDADRKGTDGALSVAFLRGKQSGIHEAISLLKKMGNNRAAKKIQKHYGIDDNGNIL